ncbi:hypothetical protein PR001_g11032 [Phytophthora rubi]|uniref:Uncharacterized protein n=1 Tax=Phytophthora rubi TaxID=129364 RepID=A0A6A3MRB2_9STRA|nr:hypothetical protein PR001_g11032 [Phytophthora rubi]
MRRALSLEEEPARKRPLLVRSSAGGSIPSWRDFSDAASESRPEAMSDSVASMVGAGPNSDLSLMATDESGNLSYSSSGSSLMSVADYMLGSGTHLPMSTATVMRGSTTGVVRSSFPGMMISITPDPPQSGATQAGTESRTSIADHPAQIPLPGSPESKRTSKWRAEDPGARLDPGPSPSEIRSNMENLRFAYAAAQEKVELAIERAARVKKASWARFNAEQSQREATESRLQATLDDNRRKQTKLREEYQRLQAANTQMSEVQRTTQIKQRKQLEALEKLTERRVVAESERRKEDEARAQYLLGVQKKPQEAEIRAQQEELQKTQDESAAKVRAEHDAELLRLREEHAQAQATHEQSVAEREETFRQLQADQEQFRVQASSKTRMSHSTSSLNPSLTSA